MIWGEINEGLSTEAWAGYRDTSRGKTAPRTQNHSDGQPAWQAEEGNVYQPWKETVMRESPWPELKLVVQGLRSQGQLGEETDPQVTLLLQPLSLASPLVKTIRNQKGESLVTGLHSRPPRAQRGGEGGSGAARGATWHTGAHSHLPDSTEQRWSGQRWSGQVFGNAKDSSLQMLQQVALSAQLPLAWWQLMANSDLSVPHLSPPPSNSFYLL